MSKRNKITFLTLVLVFGVSFFCLAKNVYAATYYVDATGGLDSSNGTSSTTPWKTIAKVNNSVFSPGDLILFKRGEIWNEALVISSSGEGGSPIVFGVYGTGDNPVLSSENSTTVTFYQKHYIEMRGIDVILNTSISYVSAVLIKDSSNVMLEGLRLIGAVPDEEIYRVFGVDIQGDSNNTIVRDCDISHFQSGVTFRANEDGLVANDCLVENNSIHDLDVGYYPGSDGVVFVWNEIFGNQDYSGVVIKNNNIWNFPDHGIDCIATLNVQIVGNRIHDSISGGDEGGIKIADDTFFTQNVYIANNVIYNVNQVGILGGQYDGSIVNNIIYNTGRNGITVGRNGLNGPNLKIIKNNIISTCGTQPNDSLINYLVGTISSLDNNIYYNPRSNIVRVNGVNYNDWVAYQALVPSMDQNSIYTDPLFIDIVNYDFHLQSTSPAIDAGVDVSLTEDYEGNAVPSGDAPDIGAFEYQQSPGVWSDWSSWGACSASCGDGKQSRKRTCSKTAYQLDCVGDSQETQNCNTQSCGGGGGGGSTATPVNGAWTDWSAWSACSANCGEGKQARTKTCTNPAPQNGGLNCVGDSREERSCNTESCVIGNVDGKNSEEKSDNSKQDNQDKDRSEEGGKIKTQAKQLFSNQLTGILAEIKEVRDTVREQAVKIKYLDKLVSDAKNLAQSIQDAINNFITYGVDENTKKLGAGERAAVIYSYQQAFKKLPETEAELEDAIRIANGRWPNKKDEQAEKKAKEQFRKIYKRIADLEKKYDEAAITVMAYGLRQKAELRNLSSEKQGIQTFINIYGYHPKTTEDWNIMQAITYSGATRKPDRDKDFLTDEQEVELGTDPNNSDSDGDGFLDGIEIENGFAVLK